MVQNEKTPSRMGFVLRNGGRVVARGGKKRGMGR